MLNWCLGREQGLIFRERGENFGFRYVVYGIEFPILIFFAKTFIYSEKTYVLQCSLGLYRLLCRIYIHIWIMSIWVTLSSSCKYIFIYKRAVLSLKVSIFWLHMYHMTSWVFLFWILLLFVCLFDFRFWVRWCLLRTFIVVFFFLLNIFCIPHYSENLKK